MAEREREREQEREQERERTEPDLVDHLLVNPQHLRMHHQPHDVLVIPRRKHLWWVALQHGDALVVPEGPAVAVLGEGRVAGGERVRMSEAVRNVFRSPPVG